MKITFVLPGIGFSGGIRTVFECSNRMIKHGHTVNIVYPLVPNRIRINYGIKVYLEIVLAALRRLVIGTNVRWFDAKARFIRIPSFSRIFKKLSEKMMPNSDVVIATEAGTAHFVSNLDDRFGKKLYFVQHYEVWDLWNSKECWKKIDALTGDMKKKSMDMALLEPEDAALRRYKNRIDSTYRLPLIKFTTSTWLQDILEKKFGQTVAGRVDIGNNTDVFGLRDEVEKNGNIIMMPFRGASWRGDADGIKAMEIVRAQYSDKSFVLYGSWMSKKYAPAWAEYHADISDEELNRLYSLADIFIMPSWVEGWSSPPMEAMACKTATVCTDVGAVSDYSINGETAMVVPAHNSDAIAEACLELIKDDKKREQIAAAGYKYIQSFTWERTVDQMEKIFNL